MSLRRPLIVAVLIAGTLSTAGIVAAAAPAAASSVAVHTSDVPAGYALKPTALSNAAMASYTGIPKAQFDKHSRITGLQNVFTHGSLQIVSFVSQYKSAGGAAWEYGNSSASDLHHGKRVAVAKVGDRSVGFTQSATSKGVKYVAYGIDFQKGVYDMTALVMGPQGKVAISGALHYAQIMVGRAH